MTPKKENSQLTPLSQTEFQELVHEKMRQGVCFTLVTVLEGEIEAFIGAAPYQRSPQRRAYRNGSYQRSLTTSVGQIDDLEVPGTRQGFQTQLFERYQRRQAELDASICQMFVGGVSTSRGGEVIETLTGTKPGASTVSRVFHSLEEEFAAWQQRPLAAVYLYAFADGSYFSVIYDHEGHKMPILAVVGINQAGEREVSGFRVGDRENQNAWEQLVDDLKRRGGQQVDGWITDGLQAMLNASATKFSASQRQGCVKHKMENILSYIPEKQRHQVEPELKAIFYQDGRQPADQQLAAFIEKYKPIYPTAVACLQPDLDACLTFYAFPKAPWKSIPTTNIIERLFGEVKKRTHKMAVAFRNENSCLLMFCAVIRSLNFRKIPIPAR